MNNRERKMLDILRQGKESYGYVGVKAEFEAEGTRIDELMRLYEIAHKADVNIGIKVGGCEAVKDLLECRQLGVEYIIAPMIESPYALSKFIDAKNKVFNQEERKNIRYLFNIETVDAYDKLDALIEQATLNDDGIDGVVFGRVDFSLSKGLSRDDVNSDTVTNYILKVAEACRVKNLDMVVGGGISMDSLPMLKKIAEVHLTRFETRKVIFAGDALGVKDVSRGLLQAVRFELLWLQNKRDYYGSIEREDDTRIYMLEERWKVLSCG